MTIADAAPSRGSRSAATPRLAPSPPRSVLDRPRLALILFETLRPARELREVGRTPLDVRVPTFLRLVAHVEEQVRVMGELLKPREAVLGGVEARLQQAQRERRQRE